MNVYLDQEFHERFYKPLFGKRHHIIELISIGIVAEKGEKYYAICRDFDVDAAWKNVWLRENVLFPIYWEMCLMDDPMQAQGMYSMRDYVSGKIEFKSLLRKYGKPRSRIAKEVKAFVGPQPTFYGYYADYDWVLLCSLFGTMMQLPEGWPMFCRDLQQMKAEIEEQYVDFGIAEDSAYPFKDEEKEHNALYDAEWNQLLHKFIIDFKTRQNGSK